LTPFTPYTFGDEAPTSIHELPRRVFSETGSLFA
jgi:hypothetical protein